jgi:ribosomal protein S18 acetylase RimI-like enzyme
MEIRTFSFEDDYQAVRELWSNSGPGVQLSPSDSAEGICHKIERDPDLFLVAEEDGRVIAAVLGGYDGRRGIVYHLSVAEEHQGRGIGKALMQALEDRLRGKGCYKYYLLVTKQNENVIEFYKKLGCEIMDMYILGKVLT